MKITNQRAKYLKDKRDKVMPVWLKMAKDYNSGVKVSVIKTKYISPETGRHYSVSRIYNIFRKLRKMRGIK